MIVNGTSTPVKAALLSAAVFVQLCGPLLGENASMTGLSQFIMQRCRIYLERTGWIIIDHPEGLTANRFTGRTDTLTVNFVKMQGDFSFRLTGTYNSTAYSREFHFKDRYDSNDRFESNILPYLISIESNKTVPGKSSFHSCLSFGYHGFSDRARATGPFEKGSVFVDYKVWHDPFAEVPGKEIPLYLSDYLEADFFVSFMPETNERHNHYPYYRKNDYFIQEHGFRINMVIYGRQGISEITRSVFGIFTGIDYFCPSYQKDILLWSDTIYSEHPHIQYCVFRAVSLGGFIQWRGDNTWTFRYMAGIGPSINSSINITGYRAETYDGYTETLNELNDIIVSKYYSLLEPRYSGGYRDENFYHSFSVPLSLSLEMDGLFNFSLSAGYDFYFFHSIKVSGVYDILNVFRIRAGYWLTDNLSIGAGYELWYIFSRFIDNTMTHHWNRMMFDARVIF